MSNLIEKWTCSTFYHSNWTIHHRTWCTSTGVCQYHWQSFIPKGRHRTWEPVVMSVQSLKYCRVMHACPMILLGLIICLRVVSIVILQQRTYRPWWSPEYQIQFTDLSVRLTYLPVQLHRSPAHLCFTINFLSMADCIIFTSLQLHSSSSVCYKSIHANRLIGPHTPNINSESIWLIF